MSKKNGKFVRVLTRIAFAGIFGVVLFTLVCNKWVELSAGGSHYDDPAKIPNNKTGLVLGTSKYLSGGYANPFFSYRMRAAADLFKSGKVEYLLVSGDNGNMSYNEPLEMRKSLIKLGVPQERIYLDFAGFRTLDAVARSSKVFLQDSVTIISQQFQNERALAVARRYGIDAVAFNARDAAVKHSFYTRFREVFARVKLVIDLFIIDKRPKFLGDTINIGG